MFNHIFSQLKICCYDFRDPQNLGISEWRAQNITLRKIRPSSDTDGDPFPTEFGSPIRKATGGGGKLRLSYVFKSTRLAINDLLFLLFFARKILVPLLNESLSSCVKVLRLIPVYLSLFSHKHTPSKWNTTTAYLLL